jgi:hypothetical protein
VQLAVVGVVLVVVVVIGIKRRRLQTSAYAFLQGGEFADHGRPLINEM